MAKKYEMPTYVPGKLQVKFKDGVSEARMNEVHRQIGTVVENVLTIGKHKVYFLRIISLISVEYIVEEYKKLPEVEYAEPIPMRYLIK